MSHVFNCSVSVVEQFLFLSFLFVCLFVVSSDGECVPGVSSLLLPVPGQHSGR